MRTIISINIVIICLLTVGVYGQDTLTSKRVDQKTLHHYYQKEWKPLIQLGNRALKSDIDFKYLRYRMGIAHYELGHYNQALLHFELVAKESLIDTTLQEYLYYSYLLSGRAADARLYAASMEEHLQKKIGFQKNRFLNDVIINVGAKFSNRTDSVGHMPFVSIGMSHQFGERFKYTHEFSFLTQNFMGLQYNQYEYYGKAELALMKALQLVAAFHYVGLDGKSSSQIQALLGEMQVDKRITQTGLVGLLGLQGNIGGLGYKMYGAISNWKTSEVGRVRLASSPFSSGIDTTFHGSSDQLAIQYGLELNYRIPTGKATWVSLGGNFALQHQGEQLASIWGATAYAQLTPKMGIELKFLQANTTYFLANEAAYVSNALGTLNAQIGATFNYQVMPKINWFANYTYENRQNNNFNFNYHTFFTGIKFRL